jgi:hypothetical protein
MVLPRLTGVIGLWTAIPAAEFLTLVLIVLKRVFEEKNK